VIKVYTRFVNLTIMGGAGDSATRTVYCCQAVAKAGTQKFKVKVFHTSKSKCQFRIVLLWNVLFTIDISAFFNTIKRSVQWTSGNLSPPNLIWSKQYLLLSLPLWNCHSSNV